MTWGVIAFNGIPIAYTVEGEHIEAREVGRELLPVTTDIEAAIRQDIAKQQRKDRGQE